MINNFLFYDEMNISFYKEWGISIYNICMSFCKLYVYTIHIVPKLFIRKKTRVVPDVRPFYIRYPVGYPVPFRNLTKTTQKKEISSDVGKYFTPNLDPDPFFLRIRIKVAKIKRFRSRKQKVNMENTITQSKVGYRGLTSDVWFLNLIKIFR